MDNINKPDFSVTDVFDSLVGKSSKNQKYKNIKNELISDSQEYENLAKADSYYLMKQKTNAGPFCNEELKKLYAEMRTSSIYYKKIRKLSDICPICSIRMTDTLDHYLPQSKYGTLIITPANLVPSCFVCNKNKLSKTFSCKEEQTLHPYYDDISNIDWLIGKISIEHEQIVCNFSIDNTLNIDSVLLARIHSHFEAFKLARTYLHYATSEINDQKQIWIDDFKTGDELQHYFERRYLHYKKNTKNFWKTALYLALYNDSIKIHSSLLCFVI